MIRREARWLLTLLAIAGLVLMFGLLAEEVMEGDTGAFDRRLILLLRQPADPGLLLGPAWLPEMLRDLTSLGSTVVLAIVTIAVVGFLTMARNWRAVALVLGSVVGGQILSTVLKMLFERARPGLIPGAPQVFTASFPSGHAMLAAVTYLTIAALLARIEPRPVLKGYYLTIGVTLTILVGISRVALGVHWPTDVLAGWCVGSAWALLCAWVAARLQKRGELDDGRHTSGA
ncbi:phosphatase PAP2 family protein [Alsobacter metallidurans]|uniref:Phosphatase PAP2 family protein n=1 Tax=Alsobacter metallidurans TaxID=340221 RepID=A0A917I7B4_9HYPH|nr:phosphatase PAP2 family protein [Alsobacter metallidurans]GGH19088.1 phosphatase PAP2 family protein [Alsobacter metallidurans]